MEEKEKPLMCADCGPLSAGPSRPRIQQVRSRWTSGTAGWGGLKCAFGRESGVSRGVEVRVSGER